MLHIITSLSSGGSEMMLRRLILASDDARFRHAVISLHGVGVHGAALQSAGIAVWSLDRSGWLGFLGFLPRVLSLIRRFRPTIVQSWLYHADLLTLFARWLSSDARRAAWTCNIRCVQTATSASSLVTRLVLRILGHASDRPVAILANSAAGARYHREHFGYHPRRWLIVPNGFDVDSHRSDPASVVDLRQRLGLAAGSRILAMVARVDPLKDHAGFLAALALVRDRNPGVHGLLIGRGATCDHPVIATHVRRLHLEGAVSGLGEQTDIPVLLAGADLLVLTSISEGFPNVLGEAMACGVPCVSTDVGAAAGIVGETGRIVPVGDPQALAGQILELLSESDPQRQERRIAARRRIIDHFTLSRCVSRYERIYGLLADRHRRRYMRILACAD